MENTIAKAQATEQFRSNIIPSLGLGGDFSSLVKYAEEIPEEDATHSTNGEDSTELDLTEIDDNEINAVSSINVACCFYHPKIHKDVAGS